MAHLASWLASRRFHCEKLDRQADDGLNECGISEAELRQEMENQIEQQSRKAPRKYRVYTVDTIFWYCETGESKNAAQKAVDDILQAEENLSSLNDTLKSLTEDLVGNTSTAEETNAIREDILGKITKLRTKINNLHSVLGSDASARNAKTMLRIYKEYLTHRMNALNLLLRIRDKGLSRRQEVEQIQRPHMREINSWVVILNILRRSNDVPEHKLYREMETNVKKREPSLKSDVNKYNVHCNRMSELIRKGKAPPNAIAPTQLQLEDVLSMDVDSDIWLELGLSDEDEAAVGRWMRDAEVRKGIKWLQQKDRCKEEMDRIFSERRALHHWFAEEWEKHKEAVSRAGESISRLFGSTAHFTRYCERYDFIVSRT